MSKVEQKSAMQKAAPFLVAAASILWGVLVVFVRKLNAESFSAMEIVCIRVYGSVAFLFPGLFLLGKRTQRSFLRVKLKDCWCFVGTGIFSIVFFSYCYFRNVEISSAAFSSILMYTSPIWVCLLARVCFGEKITRRKGAALLLALLGCILVSGITSGVGNVSVQGLLLGLGSGVGYGLYTIFGQYALNRNYHPMTVSAYTFLFACVGVLFFVNPVKIGMRLSETPGLWGIALAMAFFTTTLSFSLYTLGLRYMEPGRAAVLATLEPIVSAVVGILYYKENMSVVMFLGILMVLAASVLVSTVGTGREQSVVGSTLSRRMARNPWMEILRREVQDFWQVRKNRYASVVGACLLFLACSCAYLVGFYTEKEEQQRYYEELARGNEEWLREQQEKQVLEQKRAEEEARAKAEAEILAAEEEWSRHCPYDFALLQETNPDVYAWLLFEAGEVDYPVLQNDVDNYYLRRNLDLSSGYPGCIYSNDNNKKDFTDAFTVLYGHNMKNGTMFGSLDQLIRKDLSEEECFLFTYEPDAMQTWELWAVVEFSDVYLPDTYAGNAKGMLELAEAVKKRVQNGAGKWYSEAEIGEEDRLLILSTCVADKGNKRYLVVSRFVEEKEFVAEHKEEAPGF